MMLSVQAASQGAGQMRPVTLGVVGRMQVLRGHLPIGMIDEVVPVRDLVVHRAAGVTKGNAAIHAAGGLANDLGLADGQEKLAVMADAVRHRLVAPVLAVDLEKARDLAHAQLYSFHVWPPTMPATGTPQGFATSPLASSALSESAVSLKAPGRLGSIGRLD